jgi:hypothetical protein
MSNDVFANGREISCKKADGKSICAFPDVCMTPPENPATPPGVPVPYPNTGMAKDTTSGSKKVKISGQEVLLKNKSYFKKSTGDEAGSAAKKGVVTSVNRGKVYFNAWSMDVKFEGENVVRHLDLTTHNHGSLSNSPPMIHTDRMALINEASDCNAEKAAIDENCNPWEEKARCPDSSAVDNALSFQKEVQSVSVGGDAMRTEAQKIVDEELEYYALEIQNNPCLNALACALVPYNKAKNGGCCPRQTPEHLVPSSQFGKGRGGGHAHYKDSQAPCMCATGGKSTATHGLLGRERKKYMDDRNIPTDGKDKVWSVGDSAKCGAHSANKVQPHCRDACIEAQLKNGHEKMNIDETEEITGIQENVDPARVGDFGNAYVGGS